MSRTMVLIGTRKGLFIMESDENRADWKMRGPLCESWPIYHAIYDPASGTIYAAAASEWHGSAVFRSSDLGETWTHSSEGIGYADDDPGRFPRSRRSPSRTAASSSAPRRPGIFESKDGGETFSLLSTLAGQPGSEVWDDPANQPPGHLGISALMPDPDDPQSFIAIVQGIGAYETNDFGADWTPRNRGLRADWPREHEEVGFCVHRLVRSPLGSRPHVPAEPRRRAPERRRRQVVERDHGRPAERVRIRRGRPPARPRHLLRDPARSGPRALHARGPGRRVADERRRRQLGEADAGACRRITPTSACCAPRCRSTGTTRRASTSERAPARCSRAPTRATTGPRSPTTCRRSGRSRSPRSD